MVIVHTDKATGKQYFVPYEDPRPDLQSDATLWGKLLVAAWEHDGERDLTDSLFWTLQGLRCCGARLLREGGRVRLDGAGVEAYAGIRERYLRRHAAALTGLLKGLADV